MFSLLKMLRGLLALNKSKKKEEKKLTPWTHKEEVRQIQAYNARNRDEYGDIIYD